MGAAPGRSSAEGLLALTADLVATPSPSHREAALADRVEADLRAVPWLAVERVGDNVVARTALGRPARLVLAGHLDTVPAAGNAEPRREGDVLWGLGTSDMKGGLAVMLDLAATVPEPAVDVTWCFYACEEVSRDESGLTRLWSERPDLLSGDAAVLGEPTACRVEAGCQGTMRVRARLAGIRAHTARPFAGRNAVHKLAGLLGMLAGYESRTVVLDGCTYAEQLQAVAVAGGVAGNVVPDEASLTVNFRFAPDRDADGARRYLDDLLAPHLHPGEGDRLEEVDLSAGAPPSLGHPLLAGLVAATGEAPKAKVGWTDVASFHEHGVPAANFGPGDPLLAHHPDERVDGASLARARSVLEGLLTTGASAGS